MSDRPWWAIALQWTLWALLMSLVMGWLAKGRFRARPTSQARRLAHPPSTLMIGAVCSVFFAGLAVVSNVVPNKTTTWWTTSIFVGFAILSAPLVVDYFMANHQVSEDGLAYTKLVGTRKYLRWSDLRDVRYASSMKWFRLETRSGDVARISVMLMGLPEFARLLLANAPDDAIQSDTLPILQATAQGNPPSLWS
jgi:heme/copper-type cytochrome/quinol oxidase subunit 4